MASGDKSKYKYARINVSRNLATLAQIARDPIAKKHEDRQVVLLGDIFITTPYAFWLSDLPNVTIIIEHLLCRVGQNVDFKEYLAKILELFSIPPMLCRSNEILEGMKNLQEYFSFFGYILIIAEDITYKRLVVKALWSILLRKHQVLNRCASLKVCQEAIESSNLPELMANLLELTEDDFYGELLGVTLELAKISTTVCTKMLNERALKTILIKLDPNYKANPDTCSSFHTLPKEDPNVDTALELAEFFLKTLDGIPKTERIAMYPLGIKSLLGLRYILRVVVLNGRKTCRNFLMSLILKIMNLYPDELMAQSGILSDTTLLAAASEMGTAGTWASSVNFNTEKEDFEFKKMLLVSVYYCSKYFGGDYFIKERYVILAMLKLITPEYKSKWCEDHLCALKYYSLTILERIIPDYVEEFIEYKGLIRTATLVDFYKICPFDSTILIAALKVINVTLIAKRDFSTMLYCAEMGLCQTIQDLIYQILEEEPLNSYNQEAMQYGLDILTILIDTMEVALFKNVDLILAIFNRVLKPLDMDIGYELKMMISAVLCLWSLGLSNDDFFAHICENNGVFLLLDVLKDAKFPLKVVGLGVLVDMCEEGSAFPYLISWRNKGTTFQQLLMRIFREENELIGVKTADNGFISDHIYPLMGKSQRLQLEKLLDTNSSPAITDMDCSCRPKIYALVKLIEVRFEKQIEVANDYYKIYNYNLTLEDRLTKVLCENYLTLKMGETWLELSTLLKHKNFELVFCDQAKLETMLKYSTKWGEDMHKLQMELKEKQLKNEIISEDEFYNLLRESKLGNALNALKEIKFIAQTTENIFHLTRKMKDRMACPNINIMHRTLNPTIGLSWIKNQKITIVSDKNDTDVEVLPLVSPMTESVALSTLSSTVDSSVSFDIKNECEDDRQT